MSLSVPNTLVVWVPVQAVEAVPTISHLNDRSFNKNILYLWSRGSESRIVYSEGNVVQFTTNVHHVQYTSSLFFTLKVQTSRVGHFVPEIRNHGCTPCVGFTWIEVVCIYCPRCPLSTTYFPTEKFMTYIFGTTSKRPTFFENDAKFSKCLKHWSKWQIYVSPFGKLITVVNMTGT